LRYYKKNCDWCGKSYEGRGEFFCSVECRNKSSNGYKVIYLPDVHLEANKEIHKALKVALNFIENITPEIVIWGGDFLEMGSLSKWNDGKPLLMEGNRYIEDCKLGRSILEKVSDYCERQIYLEGNHEDWLNKYLERHPELVGKLDLRIDLGLNELGIEFIPVNKVFSIGKLSFIHGWHTNKYHTASTLDRYQDNIFYGHTHDHQSIVRINWATQIPHIGMSLGCLCSKNPHFLRNKPNSWINGFGFFEVRGDGFFTPYFIPIIDGVFTYGGVTYK
jgi:predicted phosphodiesterase